MFSLAIIFNDCTKICSRECFGTELSEFSDGFLRTCGLLSSNALAHRNLMCSVRWKDFWVCILFEVVTWLLITSFLVYRKFSIFYKSVFSLSCIGVAVYHTDCRLRDRKEKKIYFFLPKFKFTGFRLTLNFSGSRLCVLCCAFFIEGSRLDLWPFFLWN